MRLGDVIADQYQLVGLAGEGAMGSVWRAQPLDGSDQLAVKTLKLEAGGASVEIARRRFIREAEALAALDHPSIVKYRGHGANRALELYIAMEWLEGCNLGTLIRQGPMPVDETVTVIRQTAEALAFAHSRGILHRDVKPENIFLQGGSIDAVKLTDFGLARMDDVSQSLTATGTIMGTVLFMAPEQAVGEKGIDHRADLFSLGAVTWTCLAGRTPFRGTTLPEILRKLIMQDTPNIRSVRDDVPAELDTLVARLMRRSRDARPGSTDEVVAILAQLEHS